MKKVFKIILIIIVVICVSVGGFYVAYNEPLPEGKTGVEADALANKMLTALNHEAFKNTNNIEWDFIGKHYYKWNKKENKVEVKWDDKKVMLFPDSPKNNVVLEGVNNGDNQEIIESATRFFNNDSFWLVAPYKVFDSGVERRLVAFEGEDALLITYTSGGSTPGDSYLWILDDDGLPTSFKMWVSIIPIGGVEATWSDWTKTSTGALLPLSHNLFLGELRLGGVKGY